MGIPFSSTQRLSPPCREANESLDDLPSLELASTCQGVCMVCFEEGSCILQMECRHTICNACFDAQLAAKWPGPRMTFGYLRCGICRTPFANNSVQSSLDEQLRLQGQVLQVALRKLHEDGLDRQLCETLGRAATDDEKKAYAEEMMVVYACHDCDVPYCDGLMDCANAFRAEACAQRRRCKECEWSSLAGSGRCLKHGPNYAIFKCDFCCSLAVWSCGSTHYCEPCHSGGSGTHHPCPGVGLCPLGMPHPSNPMPGANGTPFVFGCSACSGCVDANECCFSDAGSDYYLDEDDIQGVCVDDTALLKDSREESIITSRRRANARIAHLASKRTRMERESRKGARFEKRVSRRKIRGVVWQEYA